MSGAKDVGNNIRQILLDFKYDRLPLGVAMRKMKAIVNDTNNEFFYRGKMRKAVEYKMIEDSGDKS